MSLFLKDTWFFWLIMFIISLVVLNVLGKRRHNEADAGMATTSDQFSMKTVFLSFRHGEATLFFMVLAGILCMFFFATGFSQEVMSLTTLGSG